MADAKVRQRTYTETELADRLKLRWDAATDDAACNLERWADLFGAADEGVMNPEVAILRWAAAKLRSIQ